MRRYAHLLMFLFASLAAAGQSRNLSDGEREIRAFFRAYPQSIERVVHRNGDWALLLGGEWYAWAHGRLLPEELAARWEEYAPIRFYQYPRDIPPLPRLDAEGRRRLEERLAWSEQNPPVRGEAFLGALLGASDHGATQRRLVEARFLGFRVRIHEHIRLPLEAVEWELASVREKDPDLRTYLDGIEQISAYNWRTIAGTGSRSYHSYGLALDLVPLSYEGKHTYWRWAKRYFPEWWSIPYEQRWMAPGALIRAFERQGFVWGGKWFFFDTMHFEYRPELLVSVPLDPIPEQSDQ